MYSRKFQKRGEEMRFNKQWFFVIFIALVLCCANTSFAATIYVSQEDVVKDFDNIQDAINAAVDGDIVLVDSGIYYESGLTWDAGDTHITVKSEDGPDSCIIDGDYGAGIFILNSGQDETDVIDGFTIRNGNANNGGGIYCNGSSPTITNCTFTGNNATKAGGGIYVRGGDVRRDISGKIIPAEVSSSPTITNCIFTYNDAVGGGGIALQYSSPTITNCAFAENEAGGGGGIASISSSPIITDCTIINNDAKKGGGIVCKNSSSPTITDCTIEDNYAEYEGGGIYCVDYSSPIITDCTIAGNDAYEGGGIYCYEGSSPTITDCTIEDNYAGDDDGDGDGGGIYCGYSSSPTVTNSAIIWNDADYEGGGIYCDGGSMTITNCTIADNDARYDDGGAIACYDGSLNILNCTIAGNDAYEGGGILTYQSSLTIKNSILWDNYADDGDTQIVLHYDSTLFIDHSDVEEGIDGIYVSGSSNLNWGPGNIILNPEFVGGACIGVNKEGRCEEDYHLSSESPCIDAGINTGAPDDDIDGQTRPFNEIVDIGSDEYVWSSSVDVVGGSATLDLDKGALTDLELVNEADLGNTGKPNVTFPFGLLSFKIIDIDEGDTVIVALTLPGNVPTDSQYWKYDEIEEEWYQFLFGSNDGDNIITLTLTDGGDGDNDGAFNGEILDPGGIGLPVSGGGDEDDKKEGHCFIATACFGTPMASEVITLRQFRDECLLTNPVGTIFVNTYYKMSPPVADFIREHPILRNIVRQTLRPLIWMSEKLTE